jgi:hypothetical protein
MPVDRVRARLTLSVTALLVAASGIRRRPTLDGVKLPQSLTNVHQLNHALRTAFDIS